MIISTLVLVVCTLHGSSTLGLVVPEQACSITIMFTFSTVDCNVLYVKYVAFAQQVSSSCCGTMLWIGCGRGGNPFQMEAARARHGNTCYSKRTRKSGSMQQIFICNWGFTLKELWEYRCQAAVPCITASLQMIWMVKDAVTDQKLCHLTFVCKLWKFAE